MNVHRTTALSAPVVLLAGLLTVAPVHAQPIRIDIPTDVVLPMSTLTRGEVIADYHMWRLSGLADLNRGEGTPDANSAEYVRAQALYATLKASPAFAMLVDELNRRPNALVVAR